MNPVQRELHSKQAQRFSATEAGLPFSSHTSPSGKVYDVYGRNAAFTNCHALTMVTERCLGTINGHTRTEAGRYYGFSPMSLRTDVEDDELVRDIVVELRKQQPEEDAAFLSEVALAMIAVYNVLSLGVL